MGNECSVSVAEVGCRGFAGQSICRASNNNHSGTQRKAIKVIEAAEGGCG